VIRSVQHTILVRLLLLDNQLSMYTHWSNYHRHV